MTIQAFIALASLCVTLIITLMGATWKFASIATTLGEESKQLRERIGSLDAALVALNTIPLLVQRVEQLEKLIHMIPRLQTELALTRRDVESIRPRQASHHDFGKIDQ